MSEHDSPPSTPPVPEAPSMRVAPLGWGQHGDPIDLPATASGWRVRRLVPGARGGAPEVLYADGVPMMVPIEATIDDLRAVVTEAYGDSPGKYRLEALSDTGQPVEGVPFAFTVIGARPGPRVESKRASDDILVRLLDNNQRLVEANVAALEKITSQMATYTAATSSVMHSAGQVVGAADAAGVTRRELPAPAMQVLAPYAPGELEAAAAKPSEPPPNWIAQIAQHGPAILSMAAQAFRFFRAQMERQAAAAPAAPAPPPASGGTP